MCIFLAPAAAAGASAATAGTTAAAASAAATTAANLLAAQLAIAVVGGAATYAQQSANAKAMEKYQNQQYQANKELAGANAVRAYSALQRRNLEEQALATKSIESVTKQAQAARAAARVAAGESGTGGISVDQVYQDFARQEAEYTGNIIRQRVFQQSQLDTEMKAVQLGQQAQTLNATPRPVEQPNLIGALLRIGAESLNAGTNYYLMTRA